MGKRARQSEQAKKHGVVERSASKGEQRDHDGWLWMVVLAGIHMHVARSRDRASRRGALRWKMSCACTLPVLFTEAGKRKLGPATRFAHFSGKQNRKANRGAKATGASEVGSHRTARDEQSLAGWTGSLKRAWRRETLGSSIVSVQSRKTSAGADDRVEARLSRRDLVGNDRTRVHEISSV